MVKQLNETFLLELYKGCLTSKNFLEIIIKHLKYHYIPEESYKKIFEKISQDYELVQSLPTIGSLTQHFNNDEAVLKVLLKIKKTNIVDQKDILLKTFEKFIINAMFIDLYGRIGELHNDGKQEKAIKLLEYESQIIAKFSLKASAYTKVFSDYEKRYNERKNKSKENVNDKIPFGIHALDFFTRGGMSRGTSTLFLARSAGGKSTILRWIAKCAARIGLKVIHFQGEGTEKECLEAYDSGWTGVSLEDIEFSTIDSKKIQAIQKAQRDIVATNGEIFVKASETFDELTINDAVDIIEDIVKIHGPVDLIVFDYLEVFNIKGKYFNSEQGERKRRGDVADKITNIAVMFNCATITATQANDIRPEVYNNPDKVLTRSDTSENKLAIKPFSNFITLNQTDDEYEGGVIRLWVDKFRKYRKPNKAIKIYQALESSRFYDAVKSLELFWNEKTNDFKK